MERSTPAATSDVVSSQKSLPPSQDPGWNDPPEWALSSRRDTTGVASTKRFLNKRVAFPLSSRDSAPPGAAGPPPPSNMPPAISQSSLTTTTAPHKPLMTPVNRDPAAESSELDFDRERALVEALDNLGSVVTEQRMDKNKLEDVQKRLDTMRSDWIEDKLDNSVRRSVLSISQALLREDIDRADEIYIILMTQHATVCRAWIPAIRHVILELRKKRESRNASPSEHSQSPLLPVEKWENEFVTK